MKNCARRPSPRTWAAGILATAAISLASAESPAGAPPPRSGFLDGEFSVSPFQQQVTEQIELLQAGSLRERAGAAEALGYLRAYAAHTALLGALEDRIPAVRREAALSLAWCGNRAAVGPLTNLLDDPDWTVAQAAAVSLNNLTGMEFPFNALAADKLRSAQARAWRRWWSGVPADRPPAEIVALIGDPADPERSLRGVRALGALGGEGAGKLITDRVLDAFRDRDFAGCDPLEKHLVQSCLRSLGRLGQPGGFDSLMHFFREVGWARYAADALADYGDPRAVPPLIEAYPLFARELNNRMKKPARVPRDDAFTGDNTQDRMLETPFAIASALTRLPLDDPQTRAALRRIGPWLVANLPSDWDGGMFYEIEADQLITAFLLERAGLRQTVCGVAFASAARPDEWVQQKKDSFEPEGLSENEVLHELSIRLRGDVPYMAAWLPAFCSESDISRLTGLLEHPNGWIRINAAKALMFLDAKSAIEPMADLLAASHPEAEYGYSGALEHAEYNDPAPRWRESLVRGLGRLGAGDHDALLIEILGDHRNVLDIQYAAALALEELATPDAWAALERAEAAHPFHSIRLVAREALWRSGRSPGRGNGEPGHTSMPETPLAESSPPETPPTENPRPERFVFIKGANTVRSDFNGQAGVDPWRQTYSITNSGPAMRVGANLFILHPDGKGCGAVTPLTNFTDGFVADCEVSWDGERILFARRLNGDRRNYREVPHASASLKEPAEPRLGGPDDPWWHLWEINVDGSGLRQLTFGPYHDVAPVYMPDGRIAFSSSRIGLRDEYHGFAATGVTVMNADGSDIHPIGFNLGADRDPAIMQDGRIGFSRLDIFYSRLKTEVTFQSIFPDGTRNLARYGPERRAFWRDVHTENAAWTMRPGYQGNPDNRNRVLRLSQPQPFRDAQAIVATSGGLAIVGPGRYQERLIPHPRHFAVTSPFPLNDTEILCAATVKQFQVGELLVTAGTPDFLKLEKGPELFSSATNIDLGLYLMDADSGRMTLLYNDPQAADFEARPIAPRPRPPILAESPVTRRDSYTANLFCHSARNSRHERVVRRGKLIRIIEGRPVVSRHQTQQNLPTNRWKNHGGTHARVLGTAPLAADGSFFVQVPADRLLQLQVLDSDRRVLGNQTFWMYARPGETRSCVGCHEPRNQTHLPEGLALSVRVPPVEMLPTGGEFSYLAKAWMKGWLPDEIEERTRTVRAMNILGRQ